MNKTVIRYYIVKSWANGAMITDTLQYYGIPFATSVISPTKIKIEINAENLERARAICADWTEGISV